MPARSRARTSSASAFPGTQGTVTFNTDQFVLFEVGEEQGAAQIELAKAIMAPSFQSSFNVVKGSVPARTDVSDEAFDDCGKKAIKDLAEANENGTLYGSHGPRPCGAGGGQERDLRRGHGALQRRVRSATAVEELVDAVAAAQ